MQTVKCFPVLFDDSESIHEALNSIEMDALCLTAIAQAMYYGAHAAETYTEAIEHISNRLYDATKAINKALPGEAVTLYE